MLTTLNSQQTTNKPPQLNFNQILTQIELIKSLDHQDDKAKLSILLEQLKINIDILSKDELSLIIKKYLEIRHSKPLDKELDQENSKNKFKAILGFKQNSITNL